MEWYRQLTAEKLIIRYVKGQPIREWHKPDRARNEALDCRVYALAALKIMQPNLKRVAERVSIDVSDQPVIENKENTESKPKTVVKRKVVKKPQAKIVMPAIKSAVVKKKRIFGNKKPS
jgi:phage terminase large subunit GpA-like protein